jgi:hypothetical protein
VKTLIDVIQTDIIRSDDLGPDWLGILYAEQLARELDWADATLTDPPGPSRPDPGER